MTDEFLHSLRRQPPPQFAGDLKRKLHAQDAEAKRRAWLLRARTIVFLIVGSAAFAGGLLVAKHQSAEKENPAPSQAQVAPEHQAATAPGYHARPLNPTFVPEGGGTSAQTHSESQQTTSASANNGLRAPSEHPADNSSGVSPNQTGPTGSGGLIRTAQPRVRVATSPLTEALVRRALRSGTRAPEIETMEADSAFVGLCLPKSNNQFDMVVTSRRMIGVELANCQDDGGANIVELKLGYQALVLTSARDSDPMKLTPSEVFLAVAKQIPDPMVEPTRLIPNPNVTWDQVGKLEYRPILVLGPARGTPRRTLFEVLVLEPGCNAHPAIKAMQDTNPDLHHELCHSLRGDRLYTEVEQNTYLIPQYLWSDPIPLALVDYQFYRDNRAQLAGSAMQGPEPSYATIADGSYPLARPIYLYVDQARIARSREVYEAMRDLQDLAIFRPVDANFIELDDQEQREQRTHRVKKLSRFDLVYK